MLSKAFLTGYKPHSESLSTCRRGSEGPLKRENLAHNIASKRLKDETNEPDTGLLERAFAETMATRAMAASEQEKSTSKQNSFRKSVVEYYDAEGPAKRYLYFRFNVSYINAKVMKYRNLTDKHENETEFWASPGKYLKRSTLISLARNISGLELPPSVYEDMTFETSAEGSTNEGAIEAMSLPAMLQGSVIEGPDDEGRDSDNKSDEDEDETEEREEEH